jgi:hypothetical protein
MFSAFSFGKIIKTILPGSIFTAGLILLIETILRANFGAEVSLLAKLADKDLGAMTAAVFVPVSLILGFFLNTAVWACCNTTMRAQSDAALASTVFPDIRRELAARLWQTISKQVDDPSIARRQFENPTRESLEYFYLPVISLDRLNYLWESYFSWYEFQINSAMALLFLLPGEILLSWSASNSNHREFFLLVTLTCVPLTLLLAWGLWRAAKQNLTEYRKSLILLITGSLAFSGKSIGGDSEAPSWWRRLFIKESTIK